MSGTVLVTLHAPFHMLVKEAEHVFPWGEGLRVRDLCAALGQKLPELREFLPDGTYARHLVVIRDGRRLTLDDPVQAGDRLHLLAPAFGG